jgi:hypothetical protein
MRKLVAFLGILLSAILLPSCRCTKGSCAKPPSSASVATPAAAADSSLVLKPTPEQLAKAVPARNIHCPTDGEKIGSMGPGVPVIYKGRSVLLCCANCPKEFAADPDKYLAVALADTIPEKP